MLCSQKLFLYVHWYLDVHAHFDALPQEFDALLLPSVCVSNSH